MFSKGTAKPVKDSVPSIISQGTHIVGDIITDGEVQVDGKVEGNIDCQSLIVADTGEVTGKVISQSIVLHGALTGTVQGKSVSLSSTARMTGDVTHETLTIETGAHFKGQCIPVEARKDSVPAKKDSEQVKKDSLVAFPDARNGSAVSQKPKEAAHA